MTYSLDLPEHYQTKEQETSQRKRCGQQEDHEQNGGLQRFEDSYRYVDVRRNTKGKHTSNAKQRHDDFCGSRHLGKW
ncbi:MAG: hypothetical protein WA400_19240 [Silvibacterium sp.]